MQGPRLVVGNARTSPRSLIAWVALTRAGLPFALERIDLHAEGALDRVLAVNPAARLPVLIEDALLLDEPLAIAEYAAEHAPALWPQHPAARARARALCADLLYGLQQLAELLPFDLTARFSRPERLVEVQQQGLLRLRALLEPLAEKAEGEGFLFGSFTLADAFALPWAVRARTYDLDLGEAVCACFARLLGLPELAAWEAMAAEEEGPQAAGTEPTAAAEPQQRPEDGAQAAPVASALRAAPPPVDAPAARGRRPLFRRRVSLPQQADTSPEIATASDRPPAASPGSATATEKGAGGASGPTPAGSAPHSRPRLDHGPAVKPLGPDAARRRFRPFGDR